MLPAGRADELFMDIVGRVADGRPVDWSRADSTPMSDDDRVLLDQLRVLEGLHRVHHPEADTTGEESTAATAAPTAAAVPAQWGALQIRGVLGVGGFGVVYRAFDPQLATEVALKVLKTPTAGAVIDEARLLARVRHPNIVSIYGAERRDGEVGLWMEFVRGRTLKQIMKQQGTFGAREAALVALDLTRALAAVHAAGLVHRDVKPHNVMREDSGRVVLMDFGAGIELEDLTDGPQRRYVGTPLYMAPELFDRQRPSPQTDLYSLGILLYHLVTGIYPLEGESPTAVHVKHLQGERLRLRDVRPDLPTEFVRIVERAVDPDPAKRYATAGELEADLAQFVVTEDHPGRRVTDGAPHPPPQPRRWRREALAAIAAVVVVAAIGASVLGLRAWRNQSAPPVAPTLRSLVVLPLRNGSGEASQDYFVDGMTELLTADLSGVSALRVIADSAAIRYKGTTKSVHEIANELHVDGIVEGSVVRSGDRVRVTIQVVHAGTNLSVWGSSFEREASDAFRLQAEIATTLVTHLRAALTPDERERLSQTYVAGAEAQDLYLRARAFLRTQSREQLPLARSLLERAVALEPRYALAWTSLSRCYTLLQQIGLMTPADSRRLGVAAATTALRLDGAMFEARGAMGEALFKYDWNWKDADVQYRRALQANPNYSMGRWQYARFLSAAGRVDEAVAQAQLAEQTDPASTDVIRTVATMLFYQRRYAEAAAKASQALAIDGSQASSHTVRGRALAALGQFDGAIGELQEAFRLSDHPGVLAELGRVYALSGNRAAAEEILVRVSQPAAARGDFVAEQDAAYIRLALGRRDEALAGLERAVAQHSERILWLRVDPRVDALRGDPRFERLIRRLGTLS